MDSTELLPTLGAEKKDIFSHSTAHNRHITISGHFEANSLGGGGSNLELLVDLKSAFSHNESTGLWRLKFC